MRSGARAIWLRVGMLLPLLALAGCNLNFMPPDEPRYEGPPQIVIAAPLPNQTFLAGATVIVQARIENAGADLARVAVLLDEALLGESYNPNETGAAALPLSIDWPTSNPGSHQLSVVAQRGDGASARADVNIRVIAQGSRDKASESEADEAAGEAADSEPQMPQVAASLLEASDLRSGPSMKHDIIGDLPADAPVVLEAVSPGRDWYRIKHEGETGAWLPAATVGEVDISALPAETGPPPPLPNLVVEEVVLAPHPPVCGETFEISAAIRNIADYRAANLGLPVVEALFADNGEVMHAKPVALMQGLDGGERAQLTASLTLTHPLDKNIVVRVSVGGMQLEETDTSDNSADSAPFRLARGDCG